MWSFDYRLIWYQWGLYHLWCWDKIKWPAHSHGKSLARLKLTQASWLFVFVNFQVTSFAFVAAKGPWKEGESEKTLRRRKELFTSSWSRVGGCNLLLSRCHNQILSLCGAKVSRSQLAIRWSFYTTEKYFYCVCKRGEVVLGHCDTSPLTPASQH